ncbi:hypothetical protein MMC13_006201 [Lambiella insularis]|nr:hypothetical protein [Lambiella insularis]
MNHPHRSSVDSERCESGSETIPPIPAAPRPTHRPSPFSPEANPGCSVEEIAAARACAREEAALDRQEAYRPPHGNELPRSFFTRPEPGTPAWEAYRLERTVAVLHNDLEQQYRQEDRPARPSPAVANTIFGNLNLEPPPRSEVRSIQTINIERSGMNIREPETVTDGPSTANSTSQQPSQFRAEARRGVQAESSHASSFSAPTADTDSPLSPQLVPSASSPPPSSPDDSPVTRERRTRDGICELLLRHVDFLDHIMGDNFTQRMLIRLATVPDADLIDFYTNLCRSVARYTGLDPDAYSPPHRSVLDSPDGNQPLARQVVNYSHIRDHSTVPAAANVSRRGLRDPGYVPPTLMHSSRPTPAFDLAAPYADPYAAYGHVADPFAALRDDPERVRRSDEPLPPPTYAERIHDRLVGENDVPPPQYERLREREARIEMVDLRGQRVTVGADGVGRRVGPARPILLRFGTRRVDSREGDVSLGGGLDEEDNQGERGGESEGAGIVVRGEREQDDQDDDSDDDSDSSGAEFIP